METIKKGSKTEMKETIANEFKAAMSGKLDPRQIEAAHNHLMSNSTSSYYATGSVMSMIFYLQFQIQINDTNAGSYNYYTFNGKGGGISSPGGGALIGDIYTDNLEALINDTCSMEFNCAFAYTSVVFFDKHSNCLGSYQSGSISTVAGIGGGTGEWSK
jgi:hypothetical protein